MKARTSAAPWRSGIRVATTSSRRACEVVRTKESNDSWAERTRAQACGAAATTTTGASSGCSSPAATVAESTVTTSEDSDTASRTADRTRLGAPPTTRSTSWVKSGSSKATRSTRTSAA